MTLMTKRELATSLKKLMQKKPLEKIRVKDVVADCGVNRQTFYYHFKDIYDLLDWIYKTEAVDRIAGYKTYDTWKQGYYMIFKYVADNHAFCMNTFYSLGRDHLDKFLYNITFHLLIGVIDEISVELNIKKEQKNFVAEVYTFILIGLVVKWMKNGMKENPEDIIEKLNKLIEGEIKNGLQKYIQ